MLYATIYEERQNHITGQLPTTRVKPCGESCAPRRDAAGTSGAAKGSEAAEGLVPQPRCTLKAEGKGSYTIVFRVC